MCSDRRKPIFALAFSLLLGACLRESPLEPSPPLPVIHAVLNPAFDSQFVNVSSTRETAPPEAVVTLTVDGRTMEFTRKVDTFPTGQLLYGPYALSTTGADRIQPGKEYRLTLTFTDGTVVTSTTRIPDVPVDVSVDSGSWAWPDSLPITWPQLDGIATYHVAMASQFEHGQASPFPMLSRFANASFVVAADEVTWGPSAHVFVTVSAVDENFYRYYAVRSDPFSGTTAPTQFTNAVGVFGAVVPISRNYYLLDAARTP